MHYSSAGNISLQMERLLDQKETGENGNAVPVVRLTDMADETLAGMIQKGSDPAFNEITKRYMEKSYSIAYQMVGDMEAARDLSQDVFVKIFKSIHKYNTNSKFFSWYYRILMNHCMNFTRRRKTVSFLPFSEVFSRSGEEPEIDSFIKESTEDVSERQRIVRTAVDKLSPKHKKVVVLCDLEGFPQEEAAEIIGVAIGTVRSRLHYARENLKKLLKNYISEM
jgi:RNA polymerase sigma-70 factor (ECF subfamily)